MTAIRYYGAVTPSTQARKEKYNANEKKPLFGAY